VAARLRTLPASLVASVKDNVLEERAFFDRHKWLYMDVTDWKDIERYVRSRIRYERALLRPLAPRLLDQPVTKPDYDVAALGRKYAERGSLLDRFGDGYLASADGRVRLVFVFLAGKATDMAANQRLSQAARAIVERLDPKSYAPDMAVGLGGDVQNVIEEQQ